jgi:hypothetical protein
LHMRGAAPHAPPDKILIPRRLRQNRAVHRFRKKLTGSTGFYQSDCMDGLLSEPDRYTFGFLLVGPPVRS